MKFKGFIRSKRKKDSANFNEEKYQNSDISKIDVSSQENLESEEILNRTDEKKEKLASSNEIPENTKQKKFPDLREAFSKIADAVNKNYSERNQAELEKAKEEIKSVLSVIRVVAFIGSSGTGKSTRAIQTAKDYDIPFIIDDGLLINGGRIVAGLSAKKANSRLESVRQALFADENRAEIMRRALAENLPKSLMILGTSDAMLTKICENLWLNPPDSYIRIEDVSTEEERRRAVHVRSTQGRHTIPVPSMEIKHEFSGYFADPINRILRRKDRISGIHTSTSDNYRTVVRPTFSTLGSYSISNEALADIARIIVRRRVNGAGDILHFNAQKESFGVVIQIEISLVYGFNAQDILKEVQRKVAAGIEDLTALNVVTVNVKAKRLIRAK